MSQLLRWFHLTSSSTLSNTTLGYIIRWSNTPECPCNSTTFVQMCFVTYPWHRFSVCWRLKPRRLIRKITEIILFQDLVLWNCTRLTIKKKKKVIVSGSFLNLHDLQYTKFPVLFTLALTKPFCISQCSFKKYFSLSLENMEDFRLEKDKENGQKVNPLNCIVYAKLAKISFPKINKKAI